MLFPNIFKQYKHSTKYIPLKYEVLLRSVQVIYDKSEKLHIRGTGFDADDHDINLELGATGHALLQADKDYSITKDANGDGLILKLLGNRRWVDLSSRTPPVALILSAVRFASNPNKNLLIEQTIIAQVLAMPSIYKNDDYIFMTASNELRINGTGFIGAKKVDLYFQPPLVKEVAYVDISNYPLINNEVVLRLRHGYSWREAPGPLFIIGVDTGGGPFKLDGDVGVKIADVRDNQDVPAVSEISSLRSEIALLRSELSDLKQQFKKKLN